MARVSNAPVRRVGASAAMALLALLAGCATGPEVQTLATGRNDVSAYALNGSDIEALRKEAARLCPLGGEVVRQSSQGATPPAAADGRWRRALQAATLWIDPPARAAQLVILCREPGDRTRLTAAPPAAAGAATPAARPASASAAEISAALPVGPVSPEW